MANQVFNPAYEGFAVGEVQWITPVIKVALVRGYTFNVTHKFVSQITTAGGVLHFTSAALTGKTATDGILDATDVVLTTPPADTNPHSVLVFQSSAVTGGVDVAPTSQRVICWIDTASGLPIRPNGSAITLQFDNGPNKILKI